MTPLQRDIMSYMQARLDRTDIIADLETLENVFIDVLIDRTVILTALEQLVKRGFVKEDQGGWQLTEAGAQYSPPFSTPPHG